MKKCFPMKNKTQQQCCKRKCMHYLRGGKKKHGFLLFGFYFRVSPQRWTSTSESSLCWDVCEPSCFQHQRANYWQALWQCTAWVALRLCMGADNSSNRYQRMTGFWLFLIMNRPFFFSAAFLTSSFASLQSLHVFKVLRFTYVSL